MAYHWSSMASSEDRHRKTVLDGLYSMYRDQVLTDVILEAGIEELHCHRNVLAAASAYFRAMFTSPVIERDEKKITLHNIEPHVLKNIIDFVYSGKIHITNDNVQDLLLCANMLELDTLARHCTDHMAQEICIDNCLDVLVLASRLACNTLREAARSYVLDHFTELRQNGYTLDILDLSQLEDIVSSDQLGVDIEETVYDVIIQWSRDKDREVYFPILFRHVRLALLKEEYINDIVLRNPLVIDDTQCRTLIEAYNSFKSEHGSNIDIYTDSSIHDFQVNTTPRHGMYNRTMIVFSGGSNNADDRSFTCFDPVTCKNYTAVMPHPTFDFKYKVDYYQILTTSDNSILFIGGIFYENHHFEDYGSALRDVFQYNMKKIKWEKRSSMTTARCLFSAAVYKNSVYVTGGKPTFPRGEPTDSVELYNPEIDLWTPMSSLPIQLYGHSSCVAKDALYIFGGKDEDDDILDTVFRYDIFSDSWTLVTTQMPKPRVQLSSFFFKGDIYLVGGVAIHENILTVSVYNPERNTWGHGQDFPEERKITACGFSEGTIYVCGGVRHLGLSGRRSRKVESRDLYKYDIVKKAWTKVVKLVQYGNSQPTTVALLNTKYLTESDYISSI